MNDSSVSTSASARAERTAFINGIDLHYEIHGDTIEGEPLLLLHGFFGAGGDFVHLFDLEDLARRHRLIIPDLRGHGRSTNPGGAFTQRQCALDLFALLDQLGVQRFKAVGVSLGGNILLHMATQRPAAVEAMVLAAATSYFPQPARAIMAGVSSENRSDDDWRMMRQRHPQGDDQIRALWKIANGFKDSYDDMSFTPPLLATIKARTLIVTGDRDPFYPIEIFLEQYRAIPGSALCVLPNGGHDAVFREARPFFAETTRAFLRGAGTGAGPDGPAPSAATG